MKTRLTIFLTLVCLLLSASSVLSQEMPFDLRYSLSEPPTPLENGYSYAFVVDIVNMGTEPAYDVRISMTPFSFPEVSCAVPVESQSLNIPSIGTGETLVENLVVDSAIAMPLDLQHPGILMLDVHYSDATGTQHSTTLLCNPKSANGGN